jgi:hypothetical protein
MKHNTMLTIASLLSILFGTFHLTDDIIRGWLSGTAINLTAVPICVVWLYGTLVLAERRSGYVIMLLASLLSLAIPVLHMMGKGVMHGSRVANSSGAFFFIWKTGENRGQTGRYRGSAVESAHYVWSGRGDLNARPPAPKAGALPGCATPRHLPLPQF